MTQGDWIRLQSLGDRLHEYGQHRRRMRVLGVTGPAVGLLIGGLLWSAPADAAIAPVVLGTAANYSVLAGQSVTNVGPTTLGGGLGLSPNTASSITGFPPGVAAFTDAGNAAALQAQSDLATAYGVAAGETPATSTVTDLTGLTLDAGVYNATSAMSLGGTLTLDGQNNPSSQFVFQAGSTLTTGSGSYINMINGANPCHVFWQVGSSATLGTDSVFRGTIMAAQSITVATGAAVQGRALAQNGSVTLDDNVFVQPDCASTAAPTGTNTVVSTSPAVTDSATTLSATVSGTGTGPSPTGTVTFNENGNSIGTVAVSAGGSASLSIPAGSTAQTRQIVAHYNGDIFNVSSTSSATALVVTTAIAPVALSPTPTVTPTPATTLPATGTSHITTLIDTGTALLLTGIALSVVFRRRRRTALHF
jgi:hypothetical protein